MGQWQSMEPGLDDPLRGSIREISYTDGIDLRLEVLKPNPAKVSRGRAQYQDEGAIHLGTVVSGDLIAVASFTPFSEDGSRSSTSFLLRGAATQADFRGGVSAIGS